MLTFSSCISRGTDHARMLRRFGLAVASFTVMFALPVQAEEKAPAGDTWTGPWGVSSSAHSTGKYPEWFPKLSAAGVTGARMFPGWGSIEPKPGEWNWEPGDKMLESAKQNHIQLSGLFGYSVKWAYPAGATGAAFPMGHLDDWAEYAGKTVEHYKDRVHYWEVWNEPNGGFKGHYGKNKWDTTTDYATLVVRAYDASKKSDPTAQIGLSCASFDVPYFEQVILAQAKMGKPESFDYFCIHPYETTGGLSEADGEIPYLWMSRLLRDMLAVQAPSKVNAEIWITEIGRRIGNQKESKEKDIVTPEIAADTLVKTYIMAIAQGIKSICWFEAQDPVGEPPGYGILDIEGKPRAAYTAMKSMTTYLGATPKYEGWLALGEKGRGYGFVFTGPKGPVLVAWMPHGLTETAISFAGKTQIIDPLTGNVFGLGAQPPADPAAKRGTSVTSILYPLTDKPVLITDISDDLLSQARANASKNFPWGGDFSNATTASIKLGPTNDDQGLIQVERSWTTPHTFPDGSTGVIVAPPAKHDHQNIKFITHPSFSKITNHDFYIKVTARRLFPAKENGSFAGMNLIYELADTKAGWPMDTTEWRGLALDTDDWQTLTWHVTDASFSKMWAFDFAFSIGSSDPFVIGKVEVSTKPFPSKW